MKVSRSLLFSPSRLFPSAKFTAVLFISGLLLGAVVHAFDHKVRSSLTESNLLSSSASLLDRLQSIFTTKSNGEKNTDTNVRGSLSRASSASVDSQIEKERTIRKGLAFGKGLSILLAAIRDPKSDDFKLIRGEFLQSVPNYSSVLLPPLKEASLNVMISTFSKDDWEAWPKTSYLNNGASTPARGYVDSILTENRELGLFLETSALLLHGLYVTTNHGRGYDLTKGFDYLVGSAQTLVGDGTANTLPAKYLLSYSVTSDPSFLPTFERIRSSLVAQYVAAHPDELERNLRLLSSLDGRYQSSSSNEQLGKALLRLSKDGTPRFRKQIVEQLVASGQLDQVFLLSSRVKVSAAQLEAVAAVDALEVKDVLLAKKLLSHSLSLASGLPAQKLVGDFLKEYGFGWVRPSLSPLERKDVEQVLVSEDNGSRFTIFGVSMILLLLIGGLLGTLFIKKKLTEDNSFLPSSGLFTEITKARAPSVFLPESQVRTGVNEQRVAEEPRKVVNYNHYSE